MPSPRTSRTWATSSRQGSQPRGGTRRVGWVLVSAFRRRAAWGLRLCCLAAARFIFFVIALEVRIHPTDTATSSTQATVNTGSLTNSSMRPWATHDAAAAIMVPTV
jgi:hypothetical protein